MHPRFYALEDLLKYLLSYPQIFLKCCKVKHLYMFDQTFSVMYTFLYVGTCKHVCWMSRISHRLSAASNTFCVLFFMYYLLSSSRARCLHLKIFFRRFSVGRCTPKSKTFVKMFSVLRVTTA